MSYLDDDLLAIFRQCDALFLDGTFWSESEMQELKISQSSATEMGHLPISGEGGSLMKVAPLQSHFALTSTSIIPIQSYCQTRRNAQRSKS